jgi:hypothetical protein
MFTKQTKFWARGTGVCILWGLDEVRSAYKQIIIDMNQDDYGMYINGESDESCDDSDYEFWIKVNQWINLNIIEHLIFCE